MKARLLLLVLFSVALVSSLSAQVPSPPQHLRVEQGLYGGAILHRDHRSNGYEITTASAGITPDVALSVAPGAVVLPKEYRLEQNYPNPFNPVTAIRFEIAGKSVVSLRIYNLIGQQVASLVDGVMDAGNYRTQWNAQDNNGGTVGSGIYFAKLVASPLNGNGQVFSQVRKMILLK
ncbi:MAG TPA: T9SS type A sorting domain-containing protein [Bacteroidota bacterium]|nr:T9SS type A sorting domain-containing protein [Bacteroidota bacterium]